MVGSGILPVALHNQKLYFLFGRENIYERSSPGWADFGGGVEKGQSIWKSAVREAHEEATGMLGDEVALDNQARASGGVYPITVGTYHTHLMRVPYDPFLPERYQFNHDLLWDKLDARVLQSSRVFEKDKIQWFTLTDLRKQRNQFRVFFRPIIDEILTKAKTIRTFARRATRKTAKHMREHISRRTRTYKRVPRHAVTPVASIE